MPDVTEYMTFAGWRFRAPVAGFNGAGRGTTLPTGPLPQGDAARTPLDN